MERIYIQSSTSKKDLNPIDWEIFQFEDYKTGFVCDIQESNLEIGYLNKFNCRLPTKSNHAVRINSLIPCSLLDCPGLIRYLFFVRRRDNHNISNYIGTSCITKIDAGWGNQLRSFQNNYIKQLNTQQKKINNEKKRQEIRAQESINKNYYDELIYHQIINNWEYNFLISILNVTELTDKQNNIKIKIVDTLKKYKKQ
jgi:hypothetical protein